MLDVFDRLFFTGSEVVLRSGIEGPVWTFWGAFCNVMWSEASHVIDL